MSDSVIVSELDSNRFGYKIARAQDVSIPDIQHINEYCNQHHVDMMIARCSADALSTIQALETDGFRMMDTLVYYRFDHTKHTISPPSMTIRPIEIADYSMVQSIAAEAFTDYLGHYHADPKLDAMKANATYEDWALRSIENRDNTHEVLVAESDNEVVGFLTVQLHFNEQGKTVLSGVAKHAQKQGVYQALMLGGLGWMADKGANHTLTSTQITNVAVQKVWSRIGFTLDHSSHTFHKWFDDA